MPATAVSVRRITIIPAQEVRAHSVRTHVTQDVSHAETELVMWPVERMPRPVAQTVYRQTRVTLTPTATTATHVRTTGATDLQTRTRCVTTIIHLQAHPAELVGNATTQATAATGRTVTTTAEQAASDA
jgi:hypothetical protein